MRLGFALLLLGAVALPVTAGAQQQLALARGPRFLQAAPAGGAPVEVEAARVAVLRMRVSLNHEGATVRQLLDEISRQSGIHFAYEQDVLELDRQVGLRADSITIAAALTEILVDAGVDVLLKSSRQAVLLRRVVVQNGAIVGRVTDAKTQAVLIGATVVVEGTHQSATTGTDGRYRFADVAPGTYTVRARYIGYVPVSASVTVSAEQEATADLALEKSVQRLDEVVTTGTVVPTEVKALPTPVSVISDSLIAQQRPQTMAELLRQTVPTAVSWDVRALPFQTMFSVRGASTLTPGGGQMKVFVDGIEAANFSDAAIDPASIARIEVIRGPQAAAIYGSDAIGGVIQIFTKRGDPTLRRPRVSTEAALGVLQTPYAGYGGVLRQDYRATLQGGGPDVSYNFGAGYTHTGDYTMPVSAQSSPSVYGGVHLSRGIVTADVTGRYYVQNAPSIVNPELLQSGFSAVAKPFYEPGQNQNQTVGARLGVAATPWWQQSVTVGLDRYNQDYAQTQPRLTTPADTLLTLSQLSYAKLSIGYMTTITGAFGSGISGSLTAGVDHYSLPRASVFASGALRTTGTITTAPGGSITLSRTTTTNTGYFAQAQFGLHETLFFTAGLRAEQNSDFGDSLGMPVSPRVGLSYVQPMGGATLKLRGSWGRAIKTPPPGYKNLVVAATSITLGNPVLAPERQQGWDAGMDLLVGTRGSVGVTYYDQTAENLIQSVRLPSDSLPTSQFQNVGQVENRGVEVEGTLTLGPLALRGQYGYARSRIAQLAPAYTGDLQVGEQSPLTPQHTAGASFALTALRGTTLTGGLTYTGSWTYYDLLGYYRCLGATGPCRNAAPHRLNRSWFVTYPGFVKLNATLTQQVTPQVTGFVSVDNLTNNEAYEMYNFQPVMGRITTVGLRVQY